MLAVEDRFHKNGVQVEQEQSSGKFDRTAAKLYKNDEDGSPREVQVGY